MDQGTLTRAQLYNAVNLVAMMTVSHLAREDNIPPTEMLLEFMSSQTADMLYDTETRLWCDGPAAVEAEYREERERQL